MKEIVVSTRTTFEFDVKQSHGQVHMEFVFKFDEADVNIPSGTYPFTADENYRIERATSKAVGKVDKVIEEVNARMVKEWSNG